MPDDSAERPDQSAQQVSGAADCSSKRAADRFQIFEALALERLQAGADATKPAAFLPLPVRLIAIAAAAIAGIGVVWSVVARVPVQVNGDYTRSCPKVVWEAWWPRPRVICTSK